MTRRRSGFLFLAAAAAAAAMPSLATQAMTVKILRPLSGARVKGIIRVLAQVTGGVPKFVVFAVDKEWPHSTNVLPYSFDLNTARLSDGPHALYARAVDGAGAEAISEGVKIVVSNPVAAPFATVLAVSNSAGPNKPKPQAAPAPTPQIPAPPVVLERPVNMSEAKPAVASPAQQVAKAEPAVAKERETDQCYFVSLRRMGSGHYLSFREALEKCGGRVSWVHIEKQARGSVRGRHIEVRIGSTEAHVNDRMFKLALPVRLAENRTFVPASFCSIALPVTRVSYRPDRLEMVMAWDAPPKVALLPQR
jgi:hypothetical protein